MMRRLLVLAMLVLSPSIAAGEYQNPLIPVTILYTNDMRGHFRPYRFSEDVTSTDGDPLIPGRDYAGMTAIAGYVNKTRQAVEAKGGVVLLFDCGNTYISSAESLYFEGKPVVEMMNTMSYHAAIFGNLDYNEGTEALARIAKWATFPFVTNHIFVKGTGRRPPFLNPHVLLNIRGLKVGVTGITYPTFDKLMKTSRIRDLHFVLSQSEIRYSVDALKDAGAELIVVLSHGHPAHIGVNVDAAPDIHVAVNSWLSTLKNAVHRTPDGMTYFFDARYKNTILSHWIDSHHTLGRIDFVFDRRTRTVHGALSAIIYLLADSVAPDTAVSALVDKYSRLYVELVGSRMNEVIGQSTGDFSMEKPPDTYACTLGKLVLGAVREHTGADIAFQNYWGIRRNLKKGPVTIKDVLDVAPFGNRVVTARVLGKNLPHMMQLFIRGPAGPHWSGYSFEGNYENVKRVRINGVWVEPDRYYTLATSDFVYEENILPHLEDVRIWDIKIQDVLIEYIKKHGTISPDGKERVERFRY